MRLRHRCRDDRVSRDRRLQGIEAVVQRQQRMLAEGDDDRFLLRSIALAGRGSFSLESAGLLERASRGHGPKGELRGAASRARVRS